MANYPALPDERNDPKIKGDGIYFFKMFRFMKPYMIPYALGMTAYSSQNFAFPLILALFSSNIMAAILALDTSAVIMSGVTLIAMIAVMMCVLGSGIYIQIISEVKAIRDLKQHLFRSFINSSLESDASKHSGEGIAAINTDANTAQRVYSGALFHFLSCIITIIGASVTVFAIDWRLGLSAIGVGLLSFIVQHRFTGPLAKVGKEQLEANAASVKAVSNIFSGAMAIRAFNMQHKALLTLDEETKKLKSLDFKRAFITMWQNLFTTVQGWLTLVVVFALGGWLVATGRLEFPMLMMAPILCMGIAQSFSEIGMAYANLQPPIAASKRVFSILEPNGQKPAQRSNFADKKANGYKIDIINMSFSYLGAESEALKNINLEIKENEMVALVGESGSGKSTLLRAIIGMYERDNLGISLGGLCYNESPTKGWRKNFAYVDQSCKLFDMSIKENIAMGAGGKASDEDIVNAAKRAFAHEFIEGLEGGYDASCGEKGGTLSGGQRQRIAIARALTKAAPVLVFDEATSALDRDSERYIMDTIHSLRSDHTILITTHNLENIVSADKIVVMDAGSIAEVGTHAELMLKKGIYYRLYSQQAG